MINNENHVRGCLDADTTKVAQQLWHGKVHVHSLAVLLVSKRLSLCKGNEAVRDRVLECHRLAAEIEYLHARAIMRALPRGRCKDWAEIYDQHAATELGNLIYGRLFGVEYGG